MAVRSTMRFNGKSFALRGHYPTKSKARNVATYLRKRGALARRVPGEEAGYENGYAVYQHYKR